MPVDLKTYYDETATILAPWSDSPDFMHGTAECLKKTYIKMHTALGTEASVEIGAHEAGYSLEMARTYDTAISLYALEASPKTHAHFSRKTNFKNYGISYINALISDCEKETVFYEYVMDDKEASSGLSSIYVRRFQYQGNTRRTRTTVKSLRGDTFIESKCKNNERIALWIDVEGSQYEVLYSLSKSFAQGKINAVFIEVEQKKLWPNQKMLDTDIINFMNEHAFTQFLRDNEYGIQYNIIFVNNTVTNCDFQAYFDYYHMLLRKMHTR